MCLNMEFCFTLLSQWVVAELGPDGLDWIPDSIRSRNIQDFPENLESNIILKAGNLRSSQDHKILCPSQSCLSDGARV